MGSRKEVRMQKAGVRIKDQGSRIERQELRDEKRVWPEMANVYLANQPFGHSAFCLSLVTFFPFDF
ncbi:MAG: hypothetical protein H8D27_04105 [Chlorobium phaeobacteroides]|uniref:Uncharacterized protein n=1 Tax=Chlorobium phaeobacteroides (strain BS1) TaxID=331678 RepID=B3EPJ8_CHLPB|nr:hypothetical protein [Chlorobium phaeobacteroides]